MDYALIERDAGAERKDQQGNDEAPEIEFATVTKRMRLVRGPGCPAIAIEQQGLVGGIDDRMNGLARH